MTELSPQAQAVLDAYRSIWLDEPLECDVECLAAALRAVADQVVPHMEEPEWGARDWWMVGNPYMNCDIELYTDHQRKRAALLAIAAELEGSN